MRVDLRRRLVRLGLISTFVVALGCTSTTAPPVVPAPDQKESEKKEPDKTITESPKSESTQPVVEKAPEERKATETQPVAANTDALKAEAESTPVAPDEATAKKESENVAQGETSDAKNAAAPDVTKASEEKKPAIDRSDLIRLIAFAPAGPLVVDLKVFLDGEPLGKVRTAAINRIFASLDEDADGRITWEQFTKNPRVKSGLYGNAAIADGANLDDLLEKYDVIKNGRVDKEELPRFFSDDRGATKAFSLLAPARPTGSPGEDSMILAWLDLDGDGQLSAEERSQARGQLRIRDADDDRVLSASELAPQMDARMAGMMPMRRPSNGPPSGMLLGPSPRWETLAYYLEEIYAGAGKKLRTSHFPGTPELAKFVDGNKDGKISPIELQNFEDIPADLMLTVRYLTKRAKDAPQLKMEASPLGGDWGKWQSAWKQTDVSAQFSADEYTISLTIVDLVGVSPVMESAKAMFDAVDADKNGYLEEKEFTMPQAASGLTFAQVDENKDGKVYLEEIEKLAAERQVVAGTQAVIKVEVTGDPFLSVLDRDGDGRLSDREMREAEKNLTTLDKNQDGLVDVGELPQSMKISVMRGIFVDGTILPDSSTVTTALTSGDMPLWFSKMDTNGDGELNEIEFIGTNEQFAGLDKDRDGVISSSEVEKNKNEKVAEAPAAPAP